MNCLTLLPAPPGRDIPSISETSPAHLLVNASNIRVTGHLQHTGSRSNVSYLEVTLTYPEASQSGEFSCEANEVTNLGHHVVFSTRHNVTAAQPTLAELARYLHDLKVCFNPTQSF